MCQNIQGSPSLSGSVGAGFPGGFPMYNQYLHHYCYMDPEEVRSTALFYSSISMFSTAFWSMSFTSLPQAVALVLGLMVVLALSLSAYYAYKTRSKIWRHGKPYIYWDDPMVRPAEGQDVQDWVSESSPSSELISSCGILTALENISQLASWQLATFIFLSHYLKGCYLYASSCLVCRLTRGLLSQGI